VVSRREILYQSPIYLTPLTGSGIIDSARVQQIILQEYVCAHLEPSQIATGAVIITGETAKRRNAREIVERLAEFAGRFVAASAGPHLESALAARGSGAAEQSKNGSTICNLDIGGGTTNLAVCKNGEITFTDWIAVGGRTCDASDAPCAKAAAEVIALVERCEQAQGSVDKVWISGGVGEILRDLQSGTAVPDDAFGDAGVVLAKHLLSTFSSNGRRLFVPQSAIRATVVGAGAHTLQLSGSTVAVGAVDLPLTDIPIVRVAGVAEPAEFTTALKKALLPLEIDWSETPIALVMPHLPRMGYAEVKDWAATIAEASSTFSATSPLIVITGHDIAAALGQLLGSQLQDGNYIVLDGIDAVAGDYIDIGAPLANGQSIPVVIKEFVFAGED
jgi:ethanolamine utilization protein EutA